MASICRISKQQLMACIQAPLAITKNGHSVWSQAGQQSRESTKRRRIVVEISSHEGSRTEAKKAVRARPVMDMVVVAAVEPETTTVAT